VNSFPARFLRPVGSSACARGFVFAAQREAPGQVRLSAFSVRARIFPLGFSVARSNFLVRLFWCPSKVTVQESALDSQSARSAPCQFLPCIYLCYGLREFWPECQAFVFLSRSLALLRQQAVRFSSEFFLPSPLSSVLGIRFVQPLVFCGRVGPWIAHPF
jgi:hypothetical protein